jgi:hypothetical protein
VLMQLMIASMTELKTECYDIESTRRLECNENLEEVKITAEKALNVPKTSRQFVIKHYSGMIYSVNPVVFFSCVTTVPAFAQLICMPLPIIRGLAE